MERRLVREDAVCQLAVVPESLAMIPRDDDRRRAR